MPFLPENFPVQPWEKQQPFQIHLQPLRMNLLPFRFELHPFQFEQLPLGNRVLAGCVMEMTAWTLFPQRKSSV